jgi:8-oxo-dGTP pyrophosphatase MutT (NUDIX family)
MPHIHEKIDFTVEVFIVHKNKVLLRVHDKLHKWLSVGGHIELDEDPNQAAIREVKEEVGLDVDISCNKTLPENEEREKELIPPEFLNRHWITKSHEHITFVYFATSNSDIINPSETEVSTQIKWFTKEELLDYDIQPKIRHYAALALKRLGTN